VTAYYETKFLPLAERPYRPGEPECHIAINTRTIQSISASEPIRSDNGQTITRIHYPERRYWVAFRRGSKVEGGYATSEDLLKVGITPPALRYPDSEAKH
jgi:hypothetical protein